MSLCVLVCLVSSALAATQFPRFNQSTMMDPIRAPQLHCIVHRIIKMGSMTWVCLFYGTHFGGVKGKPKRELPPFCEWDEVSVRLFHILSPHLQDLPNIPRSPSKASLNPDPYVDNLKPGQLPGQIPPRNQPNRSKFPRRSRPNPP